MPAALDKRIPWETHFNKWMIEVKPTGLSLRQFCIDHKLNETSTYAKFKELRMDYFREKMTDTMGKGLHIVEKTLDEAGVDPNFALKATTAMADRIGLSPQAQIISVSQNNSNIAITPIFQSLDAKEFQGLLEDESQPE